MIVDVVDTADEAVERANSSPLRADRRRPRPATPSAASRIAERLEAGIVHVNDQPIHDEPQMPFGGVKDSGWGRFGISYAMEEFTELRWITMKTRPRQFPF